MEQNQKNQSNETVQPGPVALLLVKLAGVVAFAALLTSPVVALAVVLNNSIYDPIYLVMVSSGVVNLVLCVLLMFAYNSFTKK